MRRDEADERVRRAREQQEYNAALRRQDAERRKHGRRLLAARFREACRTTAARHGTVTLAAVHRELATTVVDLTIRITELLAKDAGLTVDFDGVILQNVAFGELMR